MADTGKLIDAESVRKIVSDAYGNASSGSVCLAMASVAVKLIDLPDASEPLRARIKELECEVNCQEERIQSLERSLRIAKDEQRSCNQAFANLLQIPVYSWQRNWQTAARLVLALPADADVETINLALLLRDQGGQDA